MNDELLSYYERELTFLRQMGAEFAEKYPKVAGRLILEAEKCEDPHVERLIEAVAFLTGRIQCKLDDQLPEITESLLGILYPHYLAPIPSMSIVQFLLDPEQAMLQTGQTIPRGSMLYSKPVAGNPCRFRTCYPVTVWPIEVASARFEPPPSAGLRGESVRTVLKISLRTLGGVPVAELREKISETEMRPFSRVRFFLQGEGPLVYGLYELIFNNAIQVELRTGNPQNPAAPVSLDANCLRPVGFDREEGMLPYPDRSFLGYRFLTEYFAFPDKYLFFDVCELDRAARISSGELLEIWIYLNREFSLEKSVNAQTFRLHCTPIVNLFRQVAEPIQLTHLKTEYRVVPDVHQQSATEVYSVDVVTSAAAYDQTPIYYQPFYSFKHGTDKERPRTFWHASRRASERKDDEGTEVYLSLVDLDFNPSQPDVPTLIVRTTSFNRDLPARLPFGSAGGDFQLEGPGLFTGIRCLKKPTPTLRPPLRRGVQWRLISHLSLNYLSFLERETDQEPHAIQEILRLYDYADSAATRQQIAGITRAAARRAYRIVGSSLATGFAHGVEVTVEFDEQMFVGSGVFLLASVLERFLALHTSVNSFSQMVAATKQREGILKRWPARAGEQIVV